MITVDSPTSCPKASVLCATVTTSSSDSKTSVTLEESPTVSEILDKEAAPLGDEASTEYGPPGRIPLIVNRPELLVVLVVLVLVGSNVTTTFAPETGEPLESKTVPLRSDVSS